MYSTHSIISLLICLAALSFSQGFSVHQPSSKSSRTPSGATTLRNINQFTNKDTSTRLFQQPNEQTDKGLPDDPTKKEKAVAAAFWTTVRTLTDLSETFFVAVAIFASAELLLNIIGYDYTVDHSGVRIDTIEQLRTERQFQAQYRSTITENTQPPSQLPK